MPRPIWLDLLFLETPHQDVVFTFNGASYREDSYYFTLDQPTGAANPALVTMACLLEQWLERLQASDEAWLPVGLSDQSTTWLRCDTTGDETTVTLGWSEDEGWSFSPSSIGDMTPGSFRANDDVQPLKIYRPRLLSLVRSNLGMMQSMLST